MNFKKLLPVQNHILVTHLSVEEVQKRIADSIRHQAGYSLLRRKSSDRSYEGEIIGDEFKINRIINYRNSFLPRITGSIYTYEGQTNISIKMTLTLFVKVFMCIWLGIVGTGCLGIIINGITHPNHTLNKGFGPPMIIPFGMFASGAILMLLPFNLECNYARKFLLTLLEAQEVF